MSSKDLINVAMTPSDPALQYSPDDSRPVVVSDEHEVPPLPRSKWRAGHQRSSPQKTSDFSSASESGRLKKRQKKDKDYFGDGSEEYGSEKDLEPVEKSSKVYYPGQVHQAYRAQDPTDIDYSIQPETRPKPRNSIGETPQKSLGKKTPPSRQPKAKSTPVPKTMDELNEADKVMLEMKEEGVSWGKIKSVWESLMGHSVGLSTLSVRWCKLKENLSMVGKSNVSVHLSLYLLGQ